MENSQQLVEKVPGEVYAAIAMALYEMQGIVHDVESNKLTIGRVESPWGSKILTLREIPRRK